jgi:hypothetical protein
VRSSLKFNAKHFKFLKLFDKKGNYIIIIVIFLYYYNIYVVHKMHRAMYIDRQTERDIDKQTDTHIGRQAGRQAGWQAGRQTDR